VHEGLVQTNRILTNPQNGTRSASGIQTVAGGHRIIQRCVSPLIHTGGLENDAGPARYAMRATREGGSSASCAVAMPETPSSAVVSDTHNSRFLFSQTATLMDLQTSDFHVCVRMLGPICISVEPIPVAVLKRVHSHGRTVCRRRLIALSASLRWSCRKAGDPKNPLSLRVAFL
jgi:hypothetical protein